MQTAGDERKKQAPRFAGHDKYGAIRVVKERKVVKRFGAFTTLCIQNSKLGGVTCQIYGQLLGRFRSNRENWD